MKHDGREYWAGSPVNTLQSRSVLARRYSPLDIVASPSMEFRTAPPVVTIAKIAIVGGPTQVLSGVHV